MIRLLPILVLLAATPICSQAQTTGETPKTDLIVGYSLLRTQIANELATIGLDHVNSNGGQVALAYSFRRGIALEAQGTGYYKKLMARTVGIPATGIGNLNVYTAMVGPQFETYTESNVNPFIHALLGVARGHVSQNNQALRGFNQTVFAADLGGGIDFKVSQRLSLRGEIAYVYTRFPFSLADSGLGDSQNDVKVSAAFVFHL